MKYIFDQITQMVEISICGVPHDTLFPRAHPGEDYCLDVLHM